MVPVLILVGLFVAYKYLSANSPGVMFGTGAPSPSVGNPPAAAPTGVQLPGYTDVVGGGGPSIAETSSVQGISAGLNFIPIAGPAISAAFSTIMGGLLQASAKRAAAARNENQAVAAAVPGWDNGVAQTVNAYNKGQITGAQAAQLFNAIRQHYWNEVSGQIQSGRNGCQSGTMSKATADALFPGMKQCSGSWGAACCVGYADLENGLANLVAALDAAESYGGSHQATIPAVFASKYGGVNRPQYTVTLTKPGAKSVLGL